VIQKEGVGELASAISTKGDGYSSAGEDFEWEAWSAPWSWRALWAKRFDCICEPLLCVVNVYSCPAINQSVQVIMLLEVDRIINQKRLQVPYLMVRNILLIINVCNTHICSATYEFHGLQDAEELLQTEDYLPGPMLSRALLHENNHVIDHGIPHRSAMLL